MGQHVDRDRGRRGRRCSDVFRNKPSNDIRLSVGLLFARKLPAQSLTSRVLRINVRFWLDLKHARSSSGLLTAKHEHVKLGLCYKPGVLRF